MKFPILKKSDFKCFVWSGSFRSLFVFSLGLLFSTSVWAIIIRHDRADSRYRQFDNDYPQFFYLEERYGNKDCVATLIDEQWAITAAHCVLDTPLKDISERQSYPLNVAREDNSIVNVVLHPDFNEDGLSEERGVDLALLELGLPVQVRPIPLSRQIEEAGQEVSFLGWGSTGLGTVGKTHNDGEFRRAYNYISDVNSLLEFSFGDPRENSEAVHLLEGIPGLGDSGGPALLETDEGEVLIGVARGQLESDSLAQGQYGTTVVYERISLHLPWIEGVLLGKNYGLNSY